MLPVVRRLDRSRSALAAAVIGLPAAPLPAVESLELERFWRRFDQTAPAHLRAGYSVATVAIGLILPRLLGYRESLGGLNDEGAEHVVARAARLPVFGALAELAKLVACFAYFSDDLVQRTVRESK